LWRVAKAAKIREGDAFNEHEQVNLAVAVYRSAES